MEIDDSEATDVAGDQSAGHQAVPVGQDNSNINRYHFPEDFSLEVVEGATAVDGKGLSVWDDFTLRTPARIQDRSNGNVAADMYNRYQEDIRAMKKMGFDVYRFSISWPRILPGGRWSVGVNRKGIDYYNDIIDTVIANGMMPFVTLFHWDLPDCLQKEYEGLLSKRNIVPDFKEYAELCFWEFGDRVKFWTTINEPWTVTVNGYVRGTFPPSKPSCPQHRVLTKLPPHRNIQRESATVPITRNSSKPHDAYKVARNLLVMHAHVVDLYRAKFQPHQGGKIGIVLNSHWFEPRDSSSAGDQAAARRAVDFMIGWFLEPILHGRYPESMTNNVRPENLASFTHEEVDLVKGSIDYLGMNFYTAMYAADDRNPEGEGYDADAKVQYSFTDIDGHLIGEESGSTWLHVCPWALYSHLVELKDRYKDDLPPIYITENGLSDMNDPVKTANAACRDPLRTRYHQDHLASLLRAINMKKVDVRGYIVWSWCDNFEWAEGYMSRFGIIYVDFLNNQTRYAKDSAIWFCKFLKRRWQLQSPNDTKQDEDSSENSQAKRSFWVCFRLRRFRHRRRL